MEDTGSRCCLQAKQGDLGRTSPASTQSREQTSVVEAPACGALLWQKMNITGVFRKRSVGLGEGIASSGTHKCENLTSDSQNLCKSQAWGQESEKLMLLQQVKMRTEKSTDARGLACPAYTVGNK